MKAPIFRWAYPPNVYLLTQAAAELRVDLACHPCRTFLHLIKVEEGTPGTQPRFVDFCPFCVAKEAARCAVRAKPGEPVRYELERAAHAIRYGIVASAEAEDFARAGLMTSASKLEDWGYPEIATLLRQVARPPVVLP